MTGNNKNKMSRSLLGNDVNLPRFFIIFLISIGVDFDEMILPYLASNPRVVIVHTQ